MKTNSHDRKILLLLKDHGPLTLRNVFAYMRKPGSYKSSPEDVAARWVKHLAKERMVLMIDGHLHLTAAGLIEVAQAERKRAQNRAKRRHRSEKRKARKIQNEGSI